MSTLGRSGAFGTFRSTGLAALCCMACSTPDETTDRPLARAFDQVLHWSELRQVVPLDAAPTDSAALAQQFVENWLRQQVILHMAESNLSTEGIDLEDQLEDYRRSLVIFNYEQALVDQKLDTAVSEQEISAYYADHRANFELKDNIIRARWFKVNEPDKRTVRKMEERFLGGKSEQLHELELWLAQLGVSIVDRSGSWIPGSELRAEVPITDTEANELMGRNGKRVVRNGSTAWFVEIIEHRSQNELSPLDLVRQDIRSILLNQRKLQLISGMRDKVYEQARENKDVEVYAQ